MNNSMIGNKNIIPNIVKTFNMISPSFLTKLDLENDSSNDNFLSSIIILKKQKKKVGITNSTTAHQSIGPVCSLLIKL